MDILDFFSYAFFRHAVIVAIFTSISCGIVGSYITVKRMGAISGSIAHTAFGGLGVSYYCGFSPFWGAFFFSILAAWSIVLLKKYMEERLDVVLNALWTTGMAIGLLFIFLTPGYSSDLFSYLFGNILLLGWDDVLFTSALTLVIVVTTLFLHRSFLAVVFDEHYALIKNLPVDLLYFILFSLAAITIITVMRVVGIILLVSLLSLPAATARLYARTLSKMIVFSSVFGMVGMLGGLLVSTWLSLPSGPVIVLLVNAQYGISMLLRSNSVMNFLVRQRKSF